MGVSNMKKLINVLSASLIIGFILALVFFLYNIFNSGYISQKFYRLTVLNFQEYMNRWIAMSVLFGLGLFVFFLAGKFIWKLFFSEIIEIHIKNQKKLWVFAFCSVFFICFGWLINHYWLPNKFHPVSLLADIGIFLFIVLLGLVLTKIKWKISCDLKWQRRFIKTALILFLSYLLLNLAVNAERNFNASKLTANVILISIDTLRADHLGCYGYKKNTSPNIDEFAAENILFENCFVHEPSTAPSHMSMFTGLYPASHGVNRARTLSKSITTLAEVLKNEGYYTFGFVRQCGQLLPKCGFDRGFDEYIEKDHSYIAGLLNKIIIKNLKKNKSGKFFAFIHYYDVHSDWDKLPYDSPAPYNKMFYPDYKGDFTGGDRELVASKYLSKVNQHHFTLKKDDLKYITSLYDGGIAYTDKCLGDLFAALKELGIYESSLIIVTSDHGEEFQEHDFMLHSNPFYHEELIRVPLIVKLPTNNAKPKVVTRLVENIDIMPSILAEVGVKNVPEMQGDNFMRLIHDAEVKWKEFVFGYSAKHGPRAFVRNKKWKLLTSNLQQQEQFKMFDLSSDPQEKLDIKGNPDDVTDLLKVELLNKYKKIEKAGIQKEIIIKPQELKILKSLGYVE